MVGSAKRRMVLRIAFAGFLGIIILVGALAVLLTLGPGEAFLQDYLEKRLAAELDHEVRIGSVETNLLSRFRIDDLSVYRTEDGREMPSLKVGSATVTYTLKDLLRRRITIKTVDVESLLVAVMRDSSGSYNLPFLNARQTADSVPARSARFRVTLGSARLMGGEIRFEDRTSVNLDAVGRGIKAAARGTGDGGYAFEAGVDSCLIRYSRLPVAITGVGVKGRWDGEWARIDSLGLRLPGMELGGSLGIKAAGGPGSLEGRINVTGDAGPLAQNIFESFADTVLAVRGHLDLDAAIGGALDEPVVHLRAGMTDLALDDFVVPRLLIIAAAGPDSIRLDALTMETLGGEVGVRGSMRMDSLMSFEASAGIDGIEVRRLLELARPDTLFPEGIVEGTLAASGEIRKPLKIEAAGDLSVKRLKYQGRAIPEISVGLSFREQMAHLILRQGSSTVEAQAAVRRDRLDGSFALHIPDLGPLAGLFVPDLSGRVEARGRLGGSPDSPSVDAEIDSVRIVYRDFPLDDLRGGLRYSDGQIFFKGLTFRGELAAIDTLSPPLGMTGLEGGFRYEGFVEGPAERPDGWMRGGASRLAYKTLAIDTLALAVGLEDGQVLLEDLSLVRDSLLVRASGRYSLAESSGDLAITFHGLSALEDLSSVTEGTDTPLRYNLARPSRHIGSSNIAFEVAKQESIRARMIGSGIELGPLTASLLATPARGELAFSIDVAGDLTGPDMAAEFIVLRPGFEAVDLDSITGRVVLAGGEVRLESLDAYHGTVRNHITALLTLDPEGGGGYAVTERSGFRGRAQVERFDLRLVNPLLPEGIELDGDLSYNIKWDGTLRAPHPHGRLALRGVSLMTGEAAPAVGSVNMDVFLEDSLISIDKLTGVVRDTPFELGAVLMTSDWRDFGVDMKISLAAYGEVIGRGRLSPEAIGFEAVADRVNLDVLTALSPSIDRVEGILNARVTVTGTAASPRIRGRLRLRNLTVDSPEFSPPLVGGVVVVDFEDNMVLIDSVLVSMGKGSVFLGGRLTHADRELAEVDIDIEIRNLEFERPGIAKIAVRSGDLRYSGATGKYLLGGDIVMGDTRFIMNFDPRSILPFAGSVRKPQQELPPVLANTALDVTLRDSKDLWVDNNVARVRSHAELEILGGLSQPTVTGRVAVEEGYVMFLDRKFEISTGTVDFIERDRLNPIIELRARSKVKTYRALKTEAYEVYLDITGPLDQVKVALTSDPPLDRANILSLLTLGVTREELAGGEGEGAGASDALKARAEELTTRVVSGFVSRNVAELIGLRELSIEGNLFRRDQAGGARLVASRGLSERVDVTYSTNIGDFNENRVRMDYRLSDRFLLQGETDQEGKAAIDLKYRVRFR